MAESLTVAKRGNEDHVPKAPLMSLKEQTDKLRDEEIWGFHCNACEYEQFSPMYRCPKCRSEDLATRRFSNTGKVVSYTIQSVAAESFLNETPFAFAIIDLDDGPKLSGWIPYISRPDELPIGQKVEFVPSYKPGTQFDKV